MCLWPQQCGDKVAPALLEQGDEDGGVVGKEGRGGGPGGHQTTGRRLLLAAGRGDKGVAVVCAGVHAGSDQGVHDVHVAAPGRLRQRLLCVLPHVATGGTPCQQQLLHHRGLSVGNGVREGGPRPVPAKPRRVEGRQPRQQRAAQERLAGAEHEAVERVDGAQLQGHVRQQLGGQQPQQARN